MIPNTPIMPLLFMYVALISVLVTYVVTRKLLTANHAKTDDPSTTSIIRPAEGEFADIPEEIARQLSLMIRYTPPSGRERDASARIVKIEERLMLGGLPLTSWVKHDEEVSEKISLDSQSIEQFSVLKLNRAVQKKLPQAEITSNFGVN